MGRQLWRINGAEALRLALRAKQIGMPIAVGGRADGRHRTVGGAPEGFGAGAAAWYFPFLDPL
eukprot:354655-Chlamydomonas_euryale.AAC.2